MKSDCGSVKKVPNILQIRKINRNFAAADESIE